ncbi:MAG: DUF302 domain-containing protein [Gammaproteobacteria bacterium]|jgi:uncharacterized protein (DUF302 family)
MRVLLAVLVTVSAQVLPAKDLYMVRSELAFPEAMALLQEAIGEHGYRVSRVQRVDIGLTRSGYQTDKYRLVFFGRGTEVRELSARHRSLIPYLPLKIAVFAEGDDTILLASGFAHLRGLYPDAGLEKYFDRWEADLQTILEYVRVSD